VFCNWKTGVKSVNIRSKLESEVVLVPFRTLKEPNYAKMPLNSTRSPQSLAPVRQCSWQSISGYTCRTRSRFAESEVVIKGQQIEYKNKLNKLYRSDKITPAICKKATKYFVHTHDVQALRVIAEQEDEQAQQISHSDKQRNETKILQSEFTSHNFLPQELWSCGYMLSSCIYHKSEFN